MFIRPPKKVIKKNNNLKNNKILKNRELIILKVEGMLLKRWFVVLF